MPGVRIRALLFVQLECDEGLPFFDASGTSDQRTGAKHRAIGKTGAPKRGTWPNPVSAGYLCGTVAGCGTHPASDRFTVSNSLAMTTTDVGLKQERVNCMVEARSERPESRNLTGKSIRRKKRKACRGPYQS